MNIAIVIATYGAQEWQDLAWSRAYPSVIDQNANEVVVHHAPDLSIGPARNEAFSLVKKKDTWLLFLDADDEFDRNYVQAMKEAINSEPDAKMMLFQPAVRQIRKGQMTDPIMFQEKDLRSDNFLVIGTGVHRSLFEKVGGFSDYHHGFEDWSLWAKCWKQGARVRPVSHAFYHQHINPRSTHRQLWRDRKTQVAMHLQVQRELFPEVFQ